MADFSTKKNGEGYPDPTAHDGINGRVKYGEIYQYNEYEVLILRNQGEFSTVLRLVDFDSPGSISIDGSGTKYTNPAMLGYAYNYRLGHCVNALDNSDYERIMANVFEAIGSHLPSLVPVPAQQEMIKPAVVQMLTDKVEALGVINERLAREKVESEQEAAISRMKVDVLQQMYDSLLDRFLQKGAAMDGHKKDS